MQVDIRSKNYGDHCVLKDIDLKLEPGEVSVLFGPSGCGKSTLLNLICGLDMNFDGFVDMQGKRIAVVFQEPRLLPWLSVRENIELVEPQVDVEEILREVGVGDAVDMLAAKLSLGMARRVAFARALAVCPDLLIMDEPFVSLDQERAQSLRMMVLDLMEKQHCTTLFVTHDLEEAVQLGQHLFVMGNTPSRILAHKKINLDSQARRLPERVHAYAQTFME